MRIKEPRRPRATGAGYFRIIPDSISSQSRVTTELGGFIYSTRLVHLEVKTSAVKYSYSHHSVTQLQPEQKSKQADWGFAQPQLNIIHSSRVFCKNILMPQVRQSLLFNKIKPQLNECFATVSIHSALLKQDCSQTPSHPQRWGRWNKKKHNIPFDQREERAGNIVFCIKSQLLTYNTRTTYAASLQTSHRLNMLSSAVLQQHMS